MLSKLSNWQNKCFSIGGKEILIKAVVQAVPAYLMSVFKISQSLYDNIENTIARFWWGSFEAPKSIR